jgi:hypothetical protein
MQPVFGDAPSGVMLAVGILWPAVGAGTDSRLVVSRRP